ncbi:MAG: hypothetical protein ABSF43_08555 [Rectinemataceae bacterium]|jgi:serine/threonine protein kinase
MIEARCVINNCYILQERVVSDGVSDLWRASAIFSASLFLIRFFKESVPESVIEEYRRLVIRTYDIANDAVLDIVEADRFEGRFFVSFEYDGATRLCDLFGTGFTARLDQICGYAIELAKGLDAFHKQGLTYGTLTAAGIWIVQESGIITDIRFMKPGDLLFVPLQPRTDSSFVLEHFGYLAPEVKGIADYPVDPRSDIYSLGIHLYRFLTGFMPFRGSQAAVRVLGNAVSLSHVSKALMRRGIPEQFVLIVVRCLRRNPKLRYQTVDDLIADLYKYVEMGGAEFRLAGKGDEGTERLHLNKTRKPQPTTQILRAIDRVGYFKTAAASAPVDEAAGNRESSSASPIVWKPEEKTDRALLELEEGESLEPEDGNDLSTEDYISMSRKAVAGFSVLQKAEQVIVEERVRPAPEAEPPAAKKAPQPVEATKSPEAAPAPPSVGLPSATMEGVASPTRVLEDAKDFSAAYPVAWNRENVLANDVAKTLLAAYRKSGSGSGCFSFVEDRDDAATKGACAAVFRTMSESAVMAVMDLRGEGIFGVRLFEAFSLALGAMPSRERRRAASRIGKAESSGLFGMVANEGPETAKLDEAADALVDIATKKHPLVLVLRNAQDSDRATYELLMRIAAKSRRKPICVFAFYRRKPSAAWHVLSSMPD